MTNEKQDDATLKAFNARLAAVIDSLKIELKDWIHQHDGDDAFNNPVPSSRNMIEVTAALLDTAIDRRIDLLGEKEARESVMRTFDRRAKAMRQRLH